VDPATVKGFDLDASHPGWAALLEWFYGRAGLELPRLDRLQPEAVPQPYKSLLVHSVDMTPTLEAFFREPLGLTVLSREVQGECYLREVVLTIGREKRPVLYGAIRILLNHLPEGVRRRVLQERSPLGHILQSEETPHLSWPQAFFRAEPDRHMAAVLRCGSAAEALYGRRNVLVDGSRRLLAEVIEVLGIVEPSGEGKKPGPQDSE
jgi:chorismate-pyruvate lyase